MHGHTTNEGKSSTAREESLTSWPPQKQAGTTTVRMASRCSTSDVGFNQAILPHCLKGWSPKPAITGSESARAPPFVVHGNNTNT